jgi:hypothetical protein
MKSSKMIPLSISYQCIPIMQAIDVTFQRFNASLRDLMVCESVASTGLPKILHGLERRECGVRCHFRNLCRLSGRPD